MKGAAGSRSFRKKHAGKILEELVQEGQKLHCYLLATPKEKSEGSLVQLKK